MIGTGVRSPVSVRPHPQIAGQFILNFGARRLRASKAARKTTMPAFIDDLHSDYNQVVENFERDNPLRLIDPERRTVRLR